MHSTLRAASRQKLPDTFFAPAFTLIELIVVIAIMLMLLVVIGAAWRSMTESNVEAKAINLLSSFASVARTYAMRHKLDTVLTVDPNTGQLDLWVWAAWPVPDPFNPGPDPENPTVFVPANTWYVRAPILDETARLPRKGGSLSENLAVRIVPIDYDRLPPYSDKTLESLARFALCFDPQGRLVVRGFSLVYQINPTPLAPLGWSVVALMPGMVAPSGYGGMDPNWYYIVTSRGGIAYEPPEGPQTFLGVANPRNPATVAAAISATPFMFNQYTGRAMLKEEQR